MLCVISPGANWNPGAADRAETQEIVAGRISGGCADRLPASARAEGHGKKQGRAHHRHRDQPEHPLALVFLQRRQGRAHRSTQAGCFRRLEAGHVTVNIIAPGPVDPFQSLEAADASVRENLGGRQGDAAGHRRRGRVPVLGCREATLPAAFYRTCSSRKAEGGSF